MMYIHILVCYLLNVCIELFKPFIYMYCTYNLYMYIRQSSLYSRQTPNALCEQSTDFSHSRSAALPDLPYSEYFSMGKFWQIQICSVVRILFFVSAPCACTIFFFNNNFWQLNFQPLALLSNCMKFYPYGSFHMNSTTLKKSPPQNSTKLGTYVVYSKILAHIKI